MLLQLSWLKFNINFCSKSKTYSDFRIRLCVYLFIINFIAIDEENQYLENIFVFKFSTPFYQNNRFFFGKQNICVNIKKIY
eukprot:snap_masked-scaffold_22-processed-gene-4.46-mRNA-1 protein AED:1.00 eAED:1.00 QI:0/0/0/0/1/1/4/0/80